MPSNLLAGCHGNCETTIKSSPVRRLNISATCSSYLGVLLQSPVVFSNGITNIRVRAQTWDFALAWRLVEVTFSRECKRASVLLTANHAAPKLWVGCRAVGKSVFSLWSFFKIYQSERLLLMVRNYSFWIPRLTGSQSVSLQSMLFTRRSNGIFGHIVWKLNKTKLLVDVNYSLLVACDSRGAVVKHST